MTAYKGDTGGATPGRAATVGDMAEQTPDRGPTDNGLVSVVVVLVTLAAAAAVAYAGWTLTGWMRTDLPDRLRLGRDPGEVVLAWPLMAIAYLVSAGTAAIGFYSVVRSVRMAFTGFIEMALAPLAGAALVFAFVAFGPSVMRFMAYG